MGISDRQRTGREKKILTCRELLSLQEQRAFLRREQSTEIHRNPPRDIALHSVFVEHFSLHCPAEPEGPDSSSRVTKMGSSMPCGITRSTLIWKPTMKRTWKDAALCAALAEIRRDAGLTQRQFSRRVNKPQSWIAKIECGDRRFKVLDIFDVADALGVPPRNLLQQLLNRLPLDTFPATRRKGARNIGEQSRDGWLVLLHGCRV